MNTKSFLNGIYVATLIAVIYAISTKDYVIGNYALILFFGVSAVKKEQWKILSFILGNMSMLAYTDYKGFEWISTRANWADTSVYGWVFIAAILGVLSYLVYLDKQPELEKSTT